MRRGTLALSIVPSEATTTSFVGAGLEVSEELSVEYSIKDRKQQKDSS